MHRAHFVLYNSLSTDGYPVCSAQPAAPSAFSAQRVVEIGAERWTGVHAGALQGWQEGIEKEGLQLDKAGCRQPHCAAKARLFYSFAAKWVRPGRSGFIREVTACSQQMQ